MDDTNLTLHDLESIAKSFMATLRGIYRPPRIEYPKLEQKPATHNELARPVAGSPPPRLTEAAPTSLAEAEPGPARDTLRRAADGAVFIAGAGLGAP